MAELAAISNRSGASLRAFRSKLLPAKPYNAALLPASMSCLVQG